MSAIKWVGVAAVAGLALTGSVATQATEQHQHQRHVVLAADQQAEVIGQERARRAAVVEFLREKAARELAEAKTDFRRAAKKASAALGTAKGKVDASTERSAVQAAKRQVAEAEVADEVTAQTHKVNFVRKTVKAKVKAYKEEQERAAREAAQRAAAARQSAAPATGISSSSNDGDSRGGSDGWFSQMRSILNSVGGSGVRLVAFDGQCGRVWAAACSKSGAIMVNSSIGGWSYNRKVWAMDHELAHQYQFRVWSTLMASDTYRSLFGSNIELLANCMTQARGLNYSSQQCSGSQVAFAGGIWQGRVG